MTGRLRWLWPMLAAGALVALPGGCVTVSPAAPPQVPAGDPGRGAGLISQYGCGSCHTVPGVAGADGLVGPPLVRFGSRSYIAGKLVNNGANLQRWIQHPQQVDPGTAMPDLGVNATDAQDIAAYLFTMK
ncbi:c-type cytochrome [Rhizomonospora bruguierae]|uniref:c-type cytochrome n=1 Tax=Rhizomonospora bruguierae TaxID=1581705 RepID=UPI001BCD453F|nr:c-type cytochrome [Micromonospora sp. NBRC 107566]